MENKLKALKARNDYLLCIDSANAALQKYFMEDFPKLAQVSFKQTHASALTEMKPASLVISSEHCLF